MGTAKLLVVEDEVVVARDLQRTLGRMGYTVTDIAVSGKAALKSIADSQPDLVLMDIGLKGELDGVQTAELIGKRYDIPVIYLTSHSDTFTVRRARMTQPSGYVLKPYNENKLQDMIEAALALHRGEQTRKASPAESPVVKSSIFVAVAAAGMPEIVRILGRGGYRIKLAGRAEQAVQTLSVTRFDLVVIDQDLPDERGEILVRRLRRDVGVTAAIVVVASEASEEVLSLLKSQDIAGLVERQPGYEARLLAVIDGALGQGSRPAEPAAAPQPQMMPAEDSMESAEDTGDDGDWTDGLWDMWQVMSESRGPKG